MNLLHRLDAKITGRAVITVLSLWIASSAAVFTFGPYSAVRTAAKGPLLEERFGYGAFDPNAWINNLGDAGRELYWNFQIFDFVNAIFMALVLMTSIIYILNRLNIGNTSVRLTIALPVIMLLFEMIENCLILTWLWRFPTNSTDIAGLLAITTPIKLVVTFSTILLVLLGFLVLGLRLLRSRLRK